MFVTSSHEVSAQFREFERFTTAAMNAYIGPLVADYIENIISELGKADINGELHIMRSNGGVASAETVRELPVYTLMSGLADGYRRRRGRHRPRVLREKSPGGECGAGGEHRRRRTPVRDHCGPVRGRDSGNHPAGYRQRTT